MIGDWVQRGQIYFADVRFGSKAAMPLTLSLTATPPPVAAPAAPIKPLRYFCAATMGFRVSIDQSDRCSLRRTRGSMCDGRSSVVRSVALCLQRGKMVFVEGVGWRWGLVGVCGASPVKDQKHYGFCRSHKSESIGAEAPPTRSKSIAASAAPTGARASGLKPLPQDPRASRLPPLPQEREHRG